MEIGKRVRVTKGEHRDDYGIIRARVGNGHARRWTVRFDNDEELDFHARSLELQDDYDNSGDEEEEKQPENDVNQAGNNHGDPQPPGGDELGGEEEEEEFDEEWILQAQAAA
jgi:hypothetical protein